jgi:hypothetical protein
MNHPHGNDVAHLQRIAYGADSTPEERQRAADELRTLATATDAPAGLSPSPEAAGVTGATDGPRNPGGASGPAGSGSAASATAAADAPAPASADEPGAGRRLAIRIGVVAGAAALVVGVGAGWQLARLDGADAADSAAPAPATSPGPRLQADVLAAMPVATETLAARVFLREAVAEDAPDLPGLLDGTGLTPDGGPPEFRLLATRADGTRFFAARDGDELCLFVLFTPEPSTTRACTEGGRFPTEGLRLVASAERGRDSVDATWRPDGSLQIGTITGAPPGE